MELDSRRCAEQEMGVPVRLAFVTSEYGDVGSTRGGLGYHLSRTVPLLTAAGHDCEVFLCTGRSGEGDTAEINCDGVRVHHVAVSEPTPFDGISLPQRVEHHLRSAWAIAESLHRISAMRPFDVVQTPNYGISGLFVDVATPLVMRFSSHARTWHKAAGAGRDRFTVLSEILQRRAIERADLHFSPSRFVADLVCEELGLPVTVVRPPIPVTLDRSRWDIEWARNATGTNPYLLHAGQLGRAKGTDLVLEGMEECLRETPNLQLHLCGREAGAGPWIERLQRLYGQRVRYHARVGPERLHPLMQHAVAVVCPPRADNLPNVLIEAMSMGTPVIGVRGASVDELVVDGESGALAVPEDARSLGDAARWILSLSEGDRRRMGARARARVHELLGQERSLRDLTSLYSQAEKAGPRSRRSRFESAMLVRADLIAMNELLQAGQRPRTLWERIVARIVRRPLRSR